MNHEGVALAFLGTFLVLVSLLPDPIFLFFLKLLVLVLGIYSFYIAKKVWELERGFKEATKIGQKIKKKLDESQVT